MSTPILMREILLALKATGNTFYTKTSGRVYGAPAQYDAELPGVIVELTGTESNPHHPVRVAMTRIYCYGGRTSNAHRADECSAVYQVLCDRLRDVQDFVTANATVMDVTEEQGEDLTVDPDRNVPVSVSAWRWQIRSN
jgi:hypothetical protein